jgi:hypothetical protein
VTLLVSKARAQSHTCTNVGCPFFFREVRDVSENETARPYDEEHEGTTEPSIRPPRPLRVARLPAPADSPPVVRARYCLVCEPADKRAGTPVDDPVRSGPVVGSENLS